MVILGRMELVKRLDEIGFERTRRAISALLLSLIATIYLLLALNAPPELNKALFALAACYLVGFFGVVAEWFWGRWFASGLGWSGVMVAIGGLVQLGWTPVLAIYGGLHLAVIVPLMGKTMAARYDMQEGWRTRYGMDEYGVARLRKTVTRAAAMLPYVILWALGPKEPEQGMIATGAGLTALLLVVAGLRGVVRLRSWGLLAMAGAAALLGATAVFTDSITLFPRVYTSSAAIPRLMGGAPLVGALLLVAALAPFARPAARFLAAGRD